MYKDCEWQHDIYNKFSFKYQPDSLKYILIVDWLVSVGIPCGVLPEVNEFTEKHKGYIPVIRDSIYWKDGEQYYEDINRAREMMIFEANKIYNKEHE